MLPHGPLLWVTEGKTEHAAFDLGDRKHCEGVVWCNIRWSTTGETTWVQKTRTRADVSKQEATVGRITRPRRCKPRCCEKNTTTADEQEGTQPDTTTFSSELGASPLLVTETRTRSPPSSSQDEDSLLSFRSESTGGSSVDECWVLDVASTGSGNEPTHNRRRTRTRSPSHDAINVSWHRRKRTRSSCSVLEPAGDGVHKHGKDVSSFKQVLISGWKVDNGSEASSQECDDDSSWDSLQDSAAEYRSRRNDTDNDSMHMNDDLPTPTMSLNRWRQQKSLRRRAGNRNGIVGRHMKNSRAAVVSERICAARIPRQPSANGGPATETQLEDRTLQVACARATASSRVFDIELLSSNVVLSHKRCDARTYTGKPPVDLGAPEMEFVCCEIEFFLKNGQNSRRAMKPLAGKTIAKFSQLSTQAQRKTRAKASARTRRRRPPRGHATQRNCSRWSICSLKAINTEIPL